MSVFPYIHSSSKVTPIFLIFVNQLVNKCLIIVLICIPLIANEVEQISLPPPPRGRGCVYLYSLFSESKNNVYAFDPNAKTTVAPQM